MKKLLLMRGLPGSGKSSWVYDNGLEKYTLSSDEFRNMLSSPVQGTDGKLHINQSVTDKAWKILFTVLETRMREGSFTVVDATHVSGKGFDKYRELADRYGYEVYCKTMNVSEKECIRRQGERPECKRVPKKAISRFASIMENAPLPGWITEIDRKSDLYDSSSMSGYKKIKVIGDVHSHYDEMMEKVGEISDDILYVFCGDMLDRGDQPVETLEFIFDHMNDDNFVFLEGNHDSRLRSVVIGELFRLPPDTKQTFNKVFKGRSESEKEEILSKIREYTEIMKPFLYVDCLKDSIMFSHGGIAAPVFQEQAQFLSSKMFICGVGTRETKIDDIWNKNSEENEWQFHGHRPGSSSGRSICLDMVDGKVAAAEIETNLFTGRITYRII